MAPSKFWWSRSTASSDDHAAHSGCSPMQVPSSDTYTSFMSHASEQSQTPVRRTAAKPSFRSIPDTCHVSSSNWFSTQLGLKPRSLLAHNIQPSRHISSCMLTSEARRRRKPSLGLYPRFATGFFEMKPSVSISLRK